MPNFQLNLLSKRIKNYLKCKYYEYKINTNKTVKKDKNYMTFKRFINFCRDYIFQNGSKYKIRVTQRKTLGTLVSARRNIREHIRIKRQLFNQKYETINKYIKFFPNEICYSVYIITRKSAN